MVIYPASSNKLINAISHYKPLMVLFGGKHEPNEPTLRMLYTKFPDGEPLHKKLEKLGTLCICHPVGNRPVGFYNRLGGHLLSLAGELAWGDKILDPKINRNIHVKLGEAMEEIFAEMGKIETSPWYPDNYFDLYKAAKKLLERLIPMRGNGKKMYELLNMILQNYPVPFSEYAITSRLCHKFPRVLFLYLHGDYQIPNHQIRASDKSLHLVQEQRIFQNISLYGDQPEEDQQHLTKSEEITKNEANAIWIELSFSQLRTNDICAKKAKTAAVLYQMFCQNPRHKEERGEENKPKKASQLATRYLFEGRMRYSDFKAIRDTYSQYVLEIVRHVYQKYSDPVYR